MWHHDVTNARTYQFFRRLFDRLPVRISTSDLPHRILRKKLYHVRAYDFGVQFSFKDKVCILLTWKKFRRSAQIHWQRRSSHGFFASERRSSGGFCQTCSVNSCKTSSSHWATNGTATTTLERLGESGATHDSQSASRSGVEAWVARKSQRVGRLRCRTQPGLSPVPERTGKLAPLTPFYSIIVPVVQFFGRSSFLL